jgi:tetratricopeptide (TPR) repeat protein
VATPVPIPRRAWWILLALWRVPLELFRILIVPKFPLRIRRSYWERCRQRVSTSPEYYLLGPGRVRSCEELGEIEIAAGNLEKALTYYSEAVDLRSTNPDSPLSVSDSWLLMSYADLLQKVGRAEDARTVWRQVADFPNGTRPYQVWCQQRARENLG